jgi:hypothetical protein
MPGLVRLVPGIHAASKAWMAGTSLDKPGHDEQCELFTRQRVALHAGCGFVPI